VIESYRVYLGAGSNLGDRLEHLILAEKRLESIISDICRSRIYETLPRYMVHQPRFLNCAFTGTTTATAAELLRSIHEIESEAGRNRTVAGWMGPRPIDIDILLYGNLIIARPELQIPHPRMHERKFVLIPLLNLDPQLADPVTGSRYSEFLARLPPQGIYYHTLKSL
jgi:2-amino-4-hydroxy-6-hydroxymethyldihydropteridine diphosphokinase